METSQIIKPTIEQIEWAECEIGVIIHMDMPIFNAPYRVRDHFGDPIPAEKFTPDNLDTDQWLSAAKDLGAKYAVFVAKHNTGFSLWPTKAHDYNVSKSPYKDGKGDIVAEFIASCKKFGIRPGIYCSAATNQYLNVDYGRVLDGNAEKQKEYNDVVMKQLTELWTNYGELFEIWFDGGVIPVQKGGPDIVPLLHKLQPQAVVFQGPVGTRSLLRWVGNERGEAPEDCSALYDSRIMMFDGTVEHKEEICKDSEIWCPAESDFPNRNASTSYQGGWFWREGEESSIIPAQELFRRYLTSVGRNTNMLVGMVIDTSGRFPQADEEEFKKAGKMIRQVFSSPLDCIKENQFCITVSDTEKRTVGYLSVGEDISQGERIQEYTVHGYKKDGTEIFTHNGKIIGHKRILEVPSEIYRIELEITKSRAKPIIKHMELYSQKDGEVTKC